MSLVSRGLAIALAIAILVLSLQPATGLGGPPWGDKLQHLLAYGALTGLMGLGWPGARLWALVALATLFGFGVEIAQGLSDAGRTASLLDGLANLVGALGAAWLLHTRRRRG